MARYWVGGSGNWGDTAHWSATSGGASGASVPTGADDVFFNASSGGGTITLNVDASMASLNLTGFTGSFPSSSIYAHYVFGNLVLDTTVSSIAATLRFINTSGSWTLSGSCPGMTGQLRLGNDSYGSSATYTLANALSIPNGSIYFELSGGTFTTNNYNLTVGSISTAPAGIYGTWTFNLGSSTITTPSFGISSGNTINPGTSSIIAQGSSGSLGVNCASALYDVSIQSTGATDCSFSAASVRNLTCSNQVSGSVFPLLIGRNFVASGTLTTTSVDVTARVRMSASAVVSITPTTVSLTNTDFWRITAVGTAWSGTSLGNIGGNTNITFTTPKTVYWSLSGGGSFYSSTAWATSSGGTPAAANYPLPQDTAVFDDAGLSASGVIGIVGTTFYPAINTTSRTAAMSFSVATLEMCGNLTLSSAVAFTGSGTVRSQAKPITITQNGSTWNCGLEVLGASGPVTLAGAFTTTGILSSNLGGTITTDAVSCLAVDIRSNSSLIMNGNITCTYISTNSTVSKITSNGNKFIVTGNNRTIIGLAAGYVTDETTFECTYSGSVGGRTIATLANNQNLQVVIKVTAGLDPVTIDGYFKDVDLTGFSGSLANSTRTLAGSLTIPASVTTTAGTLGTTFAGSGLKTITTNGTLINFPIVVNGTGTTLKLVDDLTIDTARSISTTNGTLDLNGKTCTAGSFGTGAGTKTLLFNGGTLKLTASGSTVFNNSNPTNFTVQRGTADGVISMTSASAKTFVGGGTTYPIELQNSGVGALTITGSNIFTTIANSVVPTTFTFTSGTTQTVTNFNVNGTAGNLVTINASTTSAATISKAADTVSVRYCTISYSTATGGAVWQAFTSYGNVNGDNNTGWIFTQPPGNGFFFGSNF